MLRAILLAALAPDDSDVLDLFYKPVRIPGAVVFDPFMGSGATVTETVKLGARAIGRDINAVAAFLVRNALALHDRTEILKTFRAIERDVAGAATVILRGPVGGRAACAGAILFLGQDGCVPRVQFAR